MTGNPSRRRWGRLGDLLPVSAMTADGAAVLDDGSLVSVLEIRPLSPYWLSAEQLTRAHDGLKGLAAALPAGQSLTSIVFATPFDAGPLIERTKARSDRVREQLAGQGLEARADAYDQLALMDIDGVLETARRIGALTVRHLVVVPWVPARPPLHLAGVTARTFAHDRDDHHAHVARIAMHLHGLALAPRKLDGTGYLQLLAQALNPGVELPAVDYRLLLGDPTAEKQTAAAQAGELRGALAHTRIDTRSRTHLLVGDTPIQVRAITSVPSEVHPTWLTRLTDSPYPFTLAVRWQAGDRVWEKQRAKARDRRLAGWQDGRASAGARPDPDDRERAYEAEALRAELASTAGSGIYRVSVTLALANPGPAGTLSDRVDDLERFARQLERDVIASTDARLHLPAGAQLRAWRSTWPLGRDPLGLRKRYTTAMVAGTFACLAAHSGSDTGVPLGWDPMLRTLQSLDTHDPVHPNHLVVICGDSGGGKTSTVIQLIARWLAQGDTVAVIDRSGHYKTLARMVPGAAVVELGVEGGGAVNPWDVEDPGNVPREKLEYLLALHAFIFGARQQDGSYDLDTQVQSQLSRAINLVYERCATFGDSPSERVLQEVLVAIRDEQRDWGNHRLADVLDDLAQGLYDYVGAGAGAFLADRETNIPGGSPLVVFDTLAVADHRLGAVMFTVAEYVKRRGFKRVVTDEGWKMFEARSTGRWFNERVRRGRHDGQTLVFISQQFNDFLRYPEGATLIAQSSIQLVFQQKDGATDQVQLTLGLSHQAASQIRALQTYKGELAEAFLINGRHGAQLLQIRLGAVQYWLSTSEPDHDIPLRELVIARHDGDIAAALIDLGSNHAPLSDPLAA